MEDLLNFTALLNSLKRLWWVPVLTLAAGVLVSYDLCRRLPRIYNANTLILVEPQKIPANYVKPIVTTPIENRVRTIQQQVTSRSRIEKVINEAALFPELRDRVPLEQLVSRIRRGVRIQVRGTDTFKIFYEDRDPRVAAQVANAIAEVFINENVSARRAEAMGTTHFLEQQLIEKKDALEIQEKLITEFRRTHLAELPSQRDTNFRMLEGFRTRLQSNMDAISKEEDRKLQMESQLADLPTSGGTNVLTAAAQLDRMRQQLVELRGQYTEKHPEISLLKRQIKQLESEVMAQEADKDSGDQSGTLAPSVREQQLRRQISDIEVKIRDLERESERISGDIRLYENRVANAPKNEQELLRLERDYGILQQSYLELLRNKTQAEMAESLESERQGEQFVVLDRAVPPGSPSKPNVGQIMTIGCAIGFMSGIALALLFDILRPRFRSEDELIAAFGIPVLVSIPAIESETKTKSRLMTRILLGTAIVAALAGAAALIQILGE